MNFGEIFLWFLFIFLFICLIIHYGTWNTKTKNSKVKHLHQKGKPDLSSTRGESSNIYYNQNNGIGLSDPTICDSFESSYYDKNCICKTPFFGPTCSEERINPNYYDIGKSTFTDTPVLVNRLSYKYNYNNSIFTMPQTVCTDLCDADSTCLGVKYSLGPALGVKNKDSNCFLIKDLDYQTLGSPIYNPDTQGNTFLKKNKFPFFKDTGLAYVDSLPKRYWIETDSNSRLGKDPKLVKLLKNNVFSFPNYVKSDVPGTFSFSNSKDMSNPVTFTTTDSKLEIPVSFQSKNWNIIYGTFIVS